MLRYAQELGLDMARFRDDVEQRRGARRVAEDVDSADLIGVSGTPTFFINGRRHQCAYDIAALTQTVEQARQRVLAAQAGLSKPAR
ncbi:DsbA family protein [Streptomyces sp. NPDC056464]|uniref:DsbA family protein n=1 Tax=Streptomyces sp. NPDC056464 TaxID=3345828 RepID=UPI00369A7C5B